MHKFFNLKLLAIISLSLLMLVQPLSKMLVVAGYQVNKNYIANVLCVNKSKPQLHCEGKCYLSEQLAKAGQAENKVPEIFKIAAEMPFLNQAFSAEFFPGPDALVPAFTPYSAILVKGRIYAIFHPPRFF